MKKFLILSVIILLVGAVFLTGCVQENTDENDDGTDDLENTIDQNEAYNILLENILKPGSSNSQSSAFMLTDMLKPGDVITSDSGETYTIDKDTWFVFIDDQPWAFFSHPVRYIKINAQTGNYEVINENWPPLINNNSLWDKVNHNRGNVKDIYPVLNQSVPINSTDDTGAPNADYGDAPDTQNAYYGVTGSFPTYYNTTNSRVGYPGAHTLNTGEETLGLTVSAEVDASDPNDPDLVPNLVDSDKDDSLYVYINNQNAQLSFTVKVSKNAPDVNRYINVLIDFDQNGSWMKGSYGEEWVIKNYEVNVSPGTTQTITTPQFSWGNKSTSPSPIWMRVSLTRKKVNEPLFSTVGGWDGSGQFEYGEIQDHIVYLTDDIPEPEKIWPPWPKNPPKGGNPNPPGGGGPQPPGSTTGPCGTTVNYHSVIISGGDSSSHLGKGLSPATEAVGTMTDLLSDQGYSSVGSLGPGSNSMADIEQAFENLKASVKCGDHILIYIVGHGKPAKDGGGIAMKGTSGKTHDTMKPSDLSNLLNSIPACPDEDCDVEGKCCHVTVVIESCYAGNFNDDSIKGTGRTVMGSSDDEPAAATGGGVFTSGFSDASNNEDSDADDDGAVTPQEAFDEAEDSVSDNNKKSGREQEPWSDSQECECKCPCSPSIDVDKYVLDGDDWATEMDAFLGDSVSFKVTILNDGKCRDISDLSFVDSLPSCLDYGSDESVTYTDSEGQISELSLSPSLSDTAGGGTELTWDIGSEIGLFSPDEVITIEYSAATLEIGVNTNIANATAKCTYDPSITVSDSDSATVNVASEPVDEIPPVEETMSVFLEGSGECSCVGEECSGNITISSYGATDLSDGQYPISEVILSINGIQKSSATLTSDPFSSSYSEEFSDCSILYDVIVTATNSVGQSLSTNATLELVTILSIDVSAAAESYYEYQGEEITSCISYLNVTFEATDPSGENPILEVSMTKTNDGNTEDIEVTEPLGSSDFLQKEYYETDCGETFTFEMIVTTSKKVRETSIIITTPTPEL